jgi:hypothetical protein
LPQCNSARGGHLAVGSRAFRYLAEGGRWYDDDTTVIHT